MKRYLFALLLGLGMARTVWADSIMQVVSATTSGSGQQTATVFNDSGSVLVSGNVVVWDNDDTEYDRSGYPYVTTTTTADSIHTAGVMSTGTCPDQSLCEIIVAGWAPTLRLGAILTEDTVVSTSTTAGSIGDATAGNNVCYLGKLLENVDVDTLATCAGSGACRVPVQVNITCVP